MPESTTAMRFPVLEFTASQRCPRPALASLSPLPVVADRCGCSPSSPSPVQHVDLAVDLAVEFDGLDLLQRRAVEDLEVAAGAGDVELAAVGRDRRQRLARPELLAEFAQLLAGVELVELDRHLAVAVAVAEAAGHRRRRRGFVCLV